MEMRLKTAARDGKVEMAKEILRNNSTINVNWADGIGFTPLHRACLEGGDGIVSILLAHPAINVNPRDAAGNTPFMISCANGRGECARLLLMDSRVRISDGDTHGESPLKWAAACGHLDIIMSWILSGREMDLGKPGDSRTDTVGQARENGMTAVVTLLERFKGNPGKTRDEVRSELGVAGEGNRPLTSKSQVNYAVSSPPKLTRDQYVAFLDSLPEHSSSLYFAVEEGELGEVRRVLALPQVDVNWRCLTPFNQTALHLACGHGLDGAVALLLAHPRIDVNAQDESRRTPLWVALQEGETLCVRLLLNDRRTTTTELGDSTGGHLPMVLVSGGFLDILKYWIASGREMDLGEPGNVGVGSTGGSKSSGEADVATLLERFKENPGETRSAVRRELGWHDEEAAGVYALVVFVSDGILHPGLGDAAGARFFRIASQLPLELQMVLCYRLVGSRKETILREFSEAAFVDLAKRIRGSC